MRWASTSLHGTSLAVSPDSTTLYLAASPMPSEFTVGAFSAASGANVWSSSYSHPGLSKGPAVTLSPDGKTVFLRGSIGGADYTTFAYNTSTGARFWIRHFKAGGLDVPTSFTVSPDGSTLYVTGDSGPVSQVDYATVAYDTATGAQRWVRRYSGPGSSDDIPTSVAASPDGSKVYVTGQSPGLTGDSDYATIAYAAATGATVWVRRYSGPGGAGGSAVFCGLSPDGSTLFVTGGAGSGLDDFATLGYNALTGARMRVRIYKGPVGGNVARAGAVNPARSQVFVTGISDSRTNRQEFATVAYATG